jgi:hypothetical protein
MHEAMELSGDKARDHIHTDSENSVYNTHTVPTGSLGSSAGFAIMSGLCFVALGLTFIRQD